MGDSVRILFVCSANLCRSVTATEYARRAVEARRCGTGESPIEWRLESAGTAVASYQRLQAPVASAMRELSIPPREVPLMASESYVRSADLILTAERDHRATIARRFPFAVQYTFTLLQFARLLAAGAAASPNRALSSGSALIQTVRIGRSHTPPVDDHTIDIADPNEDGSATAMLECAEVIRTAVNQIFDLACGTRPDPSL